MSIFDNLFSRKSQSSNFNVVNNLPNILGLKINTAFELNAMKLQLLTPNLIVNKIAPTQIIQAIGIVTMNDDTKLLRYYTDDDAYLEILFENDISEHNILSIQLWYYYETNVIYTTEDWEYILNNDISLPTTILEGYTFKRLWEGYHHESPPVAMTEKTYSETQNGDLTDQFMMQYIRDINTQDQELHLICAEEKIVNNEYERCIFKSTGFNLQPSDIQIFG